VKNLIGKSAVAAACAALFAANAQAVYRDPDGIGQALIFPYYTTRSADGNTFNTYISIVNHTADTKALRVRFREGANGREAANFNLFLSGGEAWAGAVVPPPTLGLPARLVSSDRSCVTGFTTNAAVSVPFLDFRNAAFAGSLADGLGEGLDRTREGYVEVIEMSTVQPGVHADALRPGANGLTPPLDCGVASPTLLVGPPSGGISGTLTLINVGSGLDFTANAEALAQLSTLPFYRVESDPYPDFDSAEVDPVSHFVSNGKSYRIRWNNRIDAVSSVLMRPRLENEVILDTITQSATDWVVTFPTRRLYPIAAGAGGLFSPSYDLDRRSIPFQFRFNPRDGSGVTILDACAGLCPPDTKTTRLRLPFASTVIGFQTVPASQPAAGIPGVSGALGSPNAWIVTVPTFAQNGSASLFFDGFFTTPRTAPVTAQSLRFSDGSGGEDTIRVDGLPVVGFAVRTFRNGSLSCATGACQGNFGGLFPHKTRMTVTP
jgi:hypothetical protein